MVVVKAEGTEWGKGEIWDSRGRVAILPAGRRGLTIHLRLPVWVPLFRKYAAMDYRPALPMRIRGAALRHSLYLTTVAWFYGSFWSAATTGAVQTRLAQHLGADDFLFGVLGAVPWVAYFFQLPGSLIVEHLGRRKACFVWTVTLHRLLYVLIGLLPWLVPPNMAVSAMLMALLLLISTSLNQLGGQAWVNWMADLVPVRVRGKYFARRNRYGMAIMVVTGLASGWLLDVSGRSWFQQALEPWARRAGMPPLILLIGTIFIVAGIVGSFDILTFIRVDEPAMAAPPQEPLLKRLMRPVKDRQFMRYCVYWCGWNFAWVWNSSFFWVILLDLFDRLRDAGERPWWSDYKYVAAYVVAQVSYQLGQFIGFPIWGRAVDRFGRKPVFFVSSTLQTTLWLPWLFLSPQLLPWLALAQILGGILGGGQDIANFNMMLRFNRKGGPGYQAFGSVLFAVAGLTAPLLAGGLLKSLTWMHYPVHVGHGWSFTISRYTVLVAVGVAVKYAADFVLLPRVQDWQDKPAPQTLRFVFQNMYGNLNTLIFEPLLRLPIQAHQQWKRMAERFF